jgi:hypothetical protein
VAAVLLCLWAIAYATPASSHGYGDGYVFLRPDGKRLHLRTDLPLSSLADSVGVAPTATDAAAHMEEYIAYIRRHLRIDHQGTPVPLEPAGHKVVRVNTGSFLSLAFQPQDLTGPPEELTVTYALFFDRDPAHRGVLLVQPPSAVEPDSEEGRVSLIFSPGRTRQDLDLNNAPELAYDTQRRGAGGRKALQLAAAGIALCAVAAFVLGHLVAGGRSRKGSAV